MINEVNLFGIGIVSGIILAVVFDFFRAFRSQIRHPNAWVSCEDFFYWIFAGLFLFSLFEKYNKGVLRFYIFLGAGVGVLLYCMLLQKTIFFCFSCVFKVLNRIISIFFKIVGIIQKIVKKLIILPLKNTIKKITIMINHI